MQTSIFRNKNISRLFSAVNDGLQCMIENIFTVHRVFPPIAAPIILCQVDLGGVREGVFNPLLKEHDGPETWRQGTTIDRVDETYRIRLKEKKKRIEKKPLKDVCIAMEYDQNKL